MKRISCYLWREKKRLTIILVLLWILGIGIYNFASLNNPFKVTDPKNSKFELHDFSLQDYGDVDKLNEALVQLFPVGVTENFVNTVMTAGGGHPIYEKNEQNKFIVRYKYMARFPLFFNPERFCIFVFDDNKKLLNIHPSGGQKLFTGSPGLSEIRKMKEGKNDKL